jgi:DNA-binding NtrC family response regulator
VESTYKIDPVVHAGEHAPGHLSLLFTWDENAHAVALREGESLVVGRAAPADCIIDHRSLSRTHARLDLRGGIFTLKDLDSTNGCLLNGTAVQVARIYEGDVARLGGVEMHVCAQAVLHAPLDALSHAAFVRATADEVTRAGRFGRTFAIFALRHGDHEAAHRALHRALKPLDRLCAYAPELSLVLLLEQDLTGARRWFASLDWPNGQQVRAGLAIYPALTGSAEALISQAVAACHLAREGAIHDAELSAEGSPPKPIVRSPRMVRLYDLVARAARTTLPVLVQGETGTGKELVSRSIHDKSARATGPFKALNCATIPASLLESVLFGHERGAFTGADRQSHGIFEQAKNGTVFLDEVGELSLQAQAALLRVLDQHCLVRIGGAREIKVDARVVAATHRNLAAMVQAGAFREDLMFRLDALTLKVPPLRERREEILPLAELFLRRAREQWGATAQCISDEARAALMAYRWPGNVRQLKNVIDRAVTVCATEIVGLDDLSEELWVDDNDGAFPMNGALEPSRPHEGGVNAEGTFCSLPVRVREFEIAIIRGALEKAGENQAQAARLLGVPRRTLASKIQVYGLVAPRASLSPASGSATRHS